MDNSSKILKLIRLNEELKCKNEKKLAIFKTQLSTDGYWKEIAANILVLPRQTGKTTALKRYGRILADANPKEGVVMLKIILQTNEIVTDPRNFSILPYSEWGKARKAFMDKEGIHLLIDEFSYIPKAKLDSILNNDWLSVTMIGGLS